MKKRPQLENEYILRSNDLGIWDLCIRDSLFGQERSAEVLNATTRVQCSRSAGRLYIFIADWNELGMDDEWIVKERLSSGAAAILKGTPHRRVGRGGGGGGGARPTAPHPPGPAGTRCPRVHRRKWRWTKLKPTSKARFPYNREYSQWLNVIMSILKWIATFFKMPPCWMQEDYSEFKSNKKWN